MAAMAVEGVEICFVCYPLLVSNNKKIIIKKLKNHLTWAQYNDKKISPSYCFKKLISQKNPHIHQLLIPYGHIV